MIPVLWNSRIDYSNLWWERADHWLPWVMWALDLEEGDGNILYLIYRNGYIGIYININLYNCDRVNINKV